MEELKFEAPLAQFENEDFIDLSSCSDYKTLSELKSTILLSHSTTHANNCNKRQINKDLEALKKCLDFHGHGGTTHDESAAVNMNELLKSAARPRPSSAGPNNVNNQNNSNSKGKQSDDGNNSNSKGKQSDDGNNSNDGGSSGDECVSLNGACGGGGQDSLSFMETFSGSLEDLVNTFDEKITTCFRNYDENTETLAPVQMRSQEELMNDCQMWWTITGNYGNIFPIDWSKTYTRKLQIPTLNLNQQAKEEEESSYSDEDEAVASDLDMHSLILGRTHEHEPEPPTADEVIKEIDYMMQISEDSTPASECCCCSEDSGTCHCRGHGVKLSNGKGKQCSAPFYQEKLNESSVYELNEILVELEAQIKENSEILIAELAHRDELEYEKELKNSFISHLLAVQSKRRQLNLDKKKNKVGEKASPTENLKMKYLTTVIPYHAAKGAPKNATLQVLIKILTAIEQDSPAVPTLLTDYILKVLCPT